MPCKKAIEIRKLFTILTSISSQTNKLKRGIKNVEKNVPHYIKKNGPL